MIAQPCRPIAVSGPGESIAVPSQSGAGQGLDGVTQPTSYESDVDVEEKSF